MPEQVKPINEAKDLEVFDALEAMILSPIKRMWPEAVAETKAFMEKARTTNMKKDDREDGLGKIWKPVAEKLDSLAFVQEHMIFRINQLRSKGILDGDPREAKVLQVVPEV